MAKPTIVDIPHSLSRETARQRLRDNVGDLPAQIPGGVAEFSSRWPTPDQMVIEIVSLGQRVTATLDVQDKLVRATFELPPMLSFMAGAIASAVRRKGDQLLLS